MTSFIQTMLVSTASPLFPRPPKPLAPVYTLEDCQGSIPRVGQSGDELLLQCPHTSPSSARRPLWHPIKLLFKGSAFDMSPARKLRTIRLVEPSIGSIQNESEMPSALIEEVSLCEKSCTDGYFMTRLTPSPSSDSSDSETDEGFDSETEAFHGPFSSNSSSDSKSGVVNHGLVRSNARARGPFRPQKSGRGTSSWQLRQFAEATLGSGSLRKAVKLPEGEDLNEWLAVNVVDFYNQINLLYGSITEFCSPQTCPEMKATDEFEYLWQDSENFKRPTKMPAPEYIEHLMVWCQNNIDNEQMFPSRIGVAFPKAFPAQVRQMFKRLYRVYAHIYCHHYPVILQLGLEPHLNTSFKHYVLFIDEHSLAQGKDFWGPLGDLVESMLKSD